MSKLHVVGDMGIQNVHVDVSVLPDKKCQSYMLLVIWVYKMYMYLFYVTKMSMLHVDDIVSLRN